MLVFCTTVKNRTDHLRYTLPKNLSDNPRSRFIVLNYNSDDDLLDYLRTTFENEIADGRLNIYSYYDWPKYRFSHAKNMAHRLGIIEGGEILISMDADNFAGPGFEDSAEEVFAANPRAYLWSRMIKGETPRGVNGRIGISKRTFLKLGGYDEERFADWGSEDKDFHLRLEMSGYHGVEINREFLQAIAHNDKVRFREFPHMLRGEYREVDKTTIFKRVVNGGNFGCGAVYRNFKKQFQTLQPVPTRLFGIGMHKTGTTSLHKAFKRLGYESWHWSSAHVAKTLWQEMNNEGRSPTLEHYEALCDLPIPLLYRKLDNAYPGSKFILTVRPENEWIESLRRHYDPLHNKFRDGWDNDPFTNRVHHLTYGRTDFDAETCLNRYRAHTAEVIQYFTGRPGSLLTMNMALGDGWPQLCRFLSTDEPAVPFPREHVSSQTGE